jgi:PilZ domain
MPDNRTEVRMMCADMVEASWTDADGTAQKADALLENISPSGACLQFETAVPLGVTLHFACHKHDFSGQVRYCQYNEIGYFVGIELAPQSHWSRRTFRPQHLLDLQELVGTANKKTK